MSSKITPFVTVSIRLFGALRQYSETKPIVITLPQGTALPQLKIALIQALKTDTPHFHHEALIDLCAFASDQAILPKDTIFQESCNLSLLPPVCGG